MADFQSRVIHALATPIPEVGEGRNLQSLMIDICSKSEAQSYYSSEVMRDQKNIWGENARSGPLIFSNLLI